MKERKFSTSIQLSETQFDILSNIIDTKQGRPSNASILREAFDFYVSMKFPQFVKNK